jgi:hypothetical protein
MYIVLFTGLSGLPILIFHLPRSTCTLAVTLCVVSRVGLLQEGFQAFSQGTFSLGG